MEESNLYFDNNATTRVAPEALAAMLPFLQSDCGNPSSQHGPGSIAADALARARGSIARLLGARSAREILFTSGGTECIYTAIQAACARTPERKLIVTSAVEHPAVLEPLDELEASSGYKTLRVGVDATGLIDARQVLGAIDEHCALVSLQWVNNETGVITPDAVLRQIGAACRERGVTFHVDAMQAAGKVPLRVADLPIDMVSISAHKFHGPKGNGALWIEANYPFKALFRGGPQEFDRRAGTENVPAIVGAGRAADLARSQVENESAMSELATLRDQLEQQICAGLPDTQIHGRGAHRVASTTSFGFPGISGEAAVALLAEYGVAVSTGSACSSGRSGVSHVLAAMGIDEDLALGTLRFSLSRYTSREAVLEVASRTVEAIGQLRSLSPMHSDPHSDPRASQRDDERGAEQSESGPTGGATASGQNVGSPPATRG